MDSKPICLSCGLCCDGSLFADVKITPEELNRLPAEGMPPSLTRGSRRPRLPQPCFAWREGKCSVYGCRPAHCQSFDCDLLLKVEAGKVSTGNALELIQRCQEKAAEVKRLLRLLGNREEHLAITVRFRRVSDQAGHDRGDRKRAAQFGDLTVAMHELHCLLAEHIYPV